MGSKLDSCEVDSFSQSLRRKRQTTASTIVIAILRVRGQTGADAQSTVQQIIVPSVTITSAELFVPTTTTTTTTTTVTTTPTEPNVGSNCPNNSNLVDGSCQCFGGFRFQNGVCLPTSGSFTTNVSFALVLAAMLAKLFG